MSTLVPTDANWHTSSYSAAEGACVEVATMPCMVATRDSKDPDSPVLLFSPGRWGGFIQGVVGGQFRE